MFLQTKSGVYTKSIKEPDVYHKLEETDGDNDGRKSPPSNHDHEGEDISPLGAGEDSNSSATGHIGGQGSREKITARMAEWRKKEVSQLRHLLRLDRKGDAGSFKSLTDPDEPFTTKVPKWRIPFAKSPFLRRHAPQKDVLIFSGPHSSLFDSAVNLVKDIMGAGLLGFPLAFAWAGSFLMAVFLFLLTFLNAFTANLLIKTAYHTHVASYNEIAEKAFGRKLSVVVDLLTIILDFGSVVAYEVLIGDFACALSNAVMGTCRRPVMVFGVSLILVLPLSLLPTVNSLKYPSMVSTLFLFFFAGVVIYDSIQFMM